MKIARLSSGWNVHIGLLILRLIIGVTFLVHGWGKLTNMEGTIGFFNSLGLSSTIAYMVAYIETIGGAMLILGIWTGVSALALAVIMIGAIMTAKSGKPFMGGYEYEAVLFGALVAISALGSGKYAVIRSHLCGNCKECDCSCHPGDKRCGPDGKCEDCKCE